MTIRFTLIAAAALLGVAAPALAQDAQTDTATLRTDDLDLGSAAGQAALDRRIDRAARQVCAGIVMSGTIVGEKALKQRCEDDARAQARAQRKPA